MKSSRITGMIVLVLGAMLTQWAFRFGMASTPVDAFVRLLVLVADAFLFFPAIGALLSTKNLSDTGRDWLRNSPRLFSIYIGCALAFGVLLTVEFGCRHYFKHHYKDPYLERTEWSPTNDPMQAKGDTIHHRCLVNDTLIYDLNYAIDSLGRRLIPQLRPDSTYEEFAMLEVCSYAFGFGLKDEQTWARAMDSICDIRPYTYAISGRGPQHLLTTLHTTDLKAQITEPNGRLIYLFIDDHLPRLIGSRRLIKMWAEHFPYLFIENGQLQANGTFTTGRPLTTSFYRIISQSAFIDLFDIDIPFRISESHLRLAAAVLEKAKEEFLWQYPKGEFLVVIGPNSTLAARLSAHLTSANVPFVDYSKLLDMEQPEFKIYRTERHPNGLYYQRIAQELALHFEMHPL